MKYYFIIFSSLLFTIHHVNASLATDNSNNYIGGSWNNGDNQGTGFKSWAITESAGSGKYIGGTGLGSSSFGLYANDSFYVAAEREFNQSLAAGQTFQMTLGYTANINGNIGLTLFNSSADLINIDFAAGQSNWRLWEGGTNLSLSAAYNPITPLSFSFTYNGGNSYSYTFAEMSQTRTAISDINSIIGFRVYNNGQGAGENFGFDNIAVIPEPTTVAYLGATCLSILGLRRIKKRKYLMFKEFKSDKKTIGNLEKSPSFDFFINI